MRILTTYEMQDFIQFLTPQISSLFGYEDALAAFNTYFDAVERPDSNEYTGISNGIQHPH